MPFPKTAPHHHRFSSVSEKRSMTNTFEEAGSCVFMFIYYGVVVNKHDTKHQQHRPLVCKNSLLLLPLSAISLFDYATHDDVFFCFSFPGSGFGLATKQASLIQAALDE